MLDLIASALKRNDEQPNIELAKQLVKNQDTSGIMEIVSGLTMKKDIANDCVKVLYEIGEDDPTLIVSYVNTFLDLLKSKNNRLVWGAMTALNQIVALCSEEVFARVEEVYDAYKKGSVICIDQSISVFAKLCVANKKYEQKVLPILLNHFQSCRAKEIPQHFERTAICITKDNISLFQPIIEKRYAEMMASQQTRVNKVLKKLAL